MKPEIKVNGKDILDCNQEELNAIAKRLKWAYGQIQEKAKHKFHPGQSVWFIASRTGRRMEGIILKINQKTISMTVKNESGSSTTWKVSPSMLNASE